MSEPVTLRLSRAVLYGGGAFFGYPWKPALNMLCGDGYGTALKHFRRDHRSWFNLSLHLVCMAFQLLSNFALLACIDTRLEAWLGFGLPVPVATLTAVLWAAALLLHPDIPWMCKLAATASIAVARATATAVADRAEPGASALFLALLLAHGAAGQATAKALKKPVVTLLVLAAVKPGATALASGALGPAQCPVVTVVMAGVLLGLAAVLKDPVVATTVLGALLLKLAAVLCGSAEAADPLLYFWSCGFTAMMMQGAAHDATSETATLIALQGGGDAAAKIRYEWSHCTYFPALLLHACAIRAGLLL